MHTKHAFLGAALLATAALTTAACGPIRLDGRPHILGRLVTVDAGSVAIKHKTGRTYRVEVTPDTRIVNAKRPEDVRMCAGQRATVYLLDERRLTAASITLWDDSRC